MITNGTTNKLNQTINKYKCKNLEKLVKPNHKHWKPKKNEEKQRKTKKHKEKQPTNTILNLMFFFIF